jgi:hypothetical protein
MNRIVKSTVAGFALLVVSLGAHAQTSASANASASAKIIQPITVTKNLDLAFGTLVTGAGSAVVSNTGSRSVTGAVTALSSTTPSQAQFAIGGEAAQSISVTVPSTITISSGANNLTITTSNDMSGSAASQTLSGTYPGNGSLTVNVGGSLPLTASTPTGSYTGSFTVSASYN